MISAFDPAWMDWPFGDEKVAALWSGKAQLEHFRAFESAPALALEEVSRVAGGHGAVAAGVCETAELYLDGLALGTVVDGRPIPDSEWQPRRMAGEAGDAVHGGAA